MTPRTIAPALFAAALAAAGCSQIPVSAPRLTEKQLAERSRTILVTYTHHESPLLRAHAIEALVDTGQVATADSILQGLGDPYWGVRFSACLAVLELKYAPAKSLVAKRLTDPDLSVRAAAAGAMHVLGAKGQVSLLGQLLFDKNVIVRRNTATVLGRMGDPGAIRLLKAALHDKDISVRLQSLEAMALLGYARATQLMLTSYCRSVYDDECILAMMTLAKIKCSEAVDPLGYIYEQSKSPERFGMRLVAARALAMLDDNRGREAALAGLHSYALGDGPGRNEGQDPSGPPGTGAVRQRPGRPDRRRRRDTQNPPGQSALVARLPFSTVERTLPGCGP
jgi:HEAT repeat protein